jgi:hypothetical protein
MSIEKSRLPATPQKGTTNNKFVALLLVILSTIVGIFLFEAMCWLFLPPLGNIGEGSKLLDRVIFLDGRGSIFENHGSIFTYLPHNEVTNLTGFLSGSGFEIEYHYRFRTNNLGLVQDTDVTPGRDSLLVLGDSFTEGQGAEPWFRLIAPQIVKLGYQPINGGLPGIGFAHWLQINRYLEAKNIRIRKVVVVFISDDYRRPVGGFAPQMLQCLKQIKNCDVDKDYYFPLPPQNELASWIDKLRVARARLTHKPWLIAHAEAMLPASTRIYRALKLLLHDRLSNVQQKSREAISALIKSYGPGNIIFIHLPQKDETAGPDELGLQARRSIAEAGGQLFDGFKLCRMTPADYYKNDDHPNKQGYAKIASCVGDIIKRRWPAPQ